MKLSDRIKKIALDRGYTIAQVEKSLGWGAGYISKMNYHSPSVDRLQALADFLQCSVVDFLDEKDRPEHYFDEQTAAIAQDLFNSKEKQMLFHSLSDAEPEDILAIINIIERFKKRD